MLGVVVAGGPYSPIAGHFKSAVSLWLIHFVIDIRSYMCIYSTLFAVPLNNSHIKKQLKQSNNTGVSRTRLSDKD